MSNTPESQAPADSSSSAIAGPMRIPGTYPPEWLPDNESDSCMACDSLFTFIKRRHHCRSCGKIFCSDCCRHKAKLLYLNNKEDRVCSNCFYLIECTLTNSIIDTSTNQQPEPSSSSATHSRAQADSSQSPRVHGVLKTTGQLRPSNSRESNASSSSSPDNQSNKQVMFSDGIRPGTDLSESFPYRISPSSSVNSHLSSPFPILSRQNKSVSSIIASKGRGNKHSDGQLSKITVCDTLGYLPPIVINKDSPLLRDIAGPSSSSSNSLTNLITSQFKNFRESDRKGVLTGSESNPLPSDETTRFEEMLTMVGPDGVTTFLLLKDFYLKVKQIRMTRCELRAESEKKDESKDSSDGSGSDDWQEFWCFASDGLFKFGQNEVVLVLDKDNGDFCISRDVFKIFLTLHELALRRQSLENLGNLLFQDGLFDSRNTAGLLFVRHLKSHDISKFVLPADPYIFALVLQRWEVPWSKVFPVRLLLRLGHKLGHYPYPLTSYRSREPVYYEVGHTIISILGDFRNFRYSITHVDGLKVMLIKSEKKVLVQLNQTSYQQFNKVLDRSSNEHVLAWSAYPFLEADGHLVSVQNEDGQYETAEFYKDHKEQNNAFDNSKTEVLGASFIIFSGALKVNQTGQPAKISIVEDGLLIQMQSCALTALKQAIHYMRNFDIDCGKSDSSKILYS